MRVSKRELSLMLITATAGAIGLSFWIGDPLVKDWRAAGEIRAKLEGEKSVNQRLIDQRGRWQEDFAALRNAIPKHPPEKAVTAEMLKTIKKMADEHRLALSRLEPEKEETVGDLWEVAIDCAWEGDLESIVRFLYAVQMQGATLDIRQMTIAPAQGSPGKLKGTFTIFFAFAREKTAAAPAPTAPAAAPSAPVAPAAAVPAAPPPLIAPLAPTAQTTSPPPANAESAHGP
jgi:hypothetical protein